MIFAFSEMLHEETTKIKESYSVSTDSRLFFNSLRSVKKFTFPRSFLSETHAQRLCEECYVGSQVLESYETLPRFPLSSIML